VRTKKLVRKSTLDSIPYYIDSIARISNVGYLNIATDNCVHTYEILLKKKSISKLSRNVPLFKIKRYPLIQPSFWDYLDYSFSSFCQSSIVSPINGLISEIKYISRNGDLTLEHLWTKSCVKKERVRERKTAFFHEICIRIL